MSKHLRKQMFMVNSPMIRSENITLYYNQRAILAAPENRFWRFDDAYRSIGPE